MIIERLGPQTKKWDFVPWEPLEEQASLYHKSMQQPSERRHMEMHVEMYQGLLKA